SGCYSVSRSTRTLHVSEITRLPPCSSLFPYTTLFRSAAVSLFLRLSVPAQPDTDPELLQRHGFVPAPVYGSQLQTAAIPGMQPEARLAIDWQLFRERLDDGSEVELRRPVYRIDEPSYGPLPADLLIRSE